MSNRINAKATLCLLTYNQERFIQEAIDGALSQSYPSLDIVISDDCSTDSTFSLIKKAVYNYKGNHNIKINQNSTNLGLVRHLNFLISQLIETEIIILSAGDDISSSSRVESVIEVFNKYPNVMVVTSNKQIINNKSIVISNQSKRAFSKTFTIKELLRSYSFMVGEGVALSFKKEVFNFFGELNSCCPTEDSTIRNRGLLMGSIYYNHEAVYYYRVHDTNMSGPQNVLKLSYTEIANQYIKDINHAFLTKKINKKEFDFLKFKVWLYILNQKFNSNLIYSKSVLKRYFYRILIKALKFLHKLKLLFVR